MRKMITKEVTVTIVQMARLEVKEGLPVAVPLQDETLLGNISHEKAQKIMNKKYDSVTVFNIETHTKVYEMEIEKFLSLATLKYEDKDEAEKLEIQKLEKARDEAQSKVKRVI